MRRRQFGHGGAALPQLAEHVAPRRIRQGPEHLVEDFRHCLPVMGEGCSMLRRLRSGSKNDT
jgi:hypothetical protein